MVITISKQAAVEKPTANDIRFIWSREDAYEKKELSVREFAEMCGKGHTWRAALYKGESEYFRKSDADCITAIALDIDNSEVNPYEIAAFAASVGLPVNFIYPSLRQEPTHWYDSLAKSARVSVATNRYINSTYAETRIFSTPGLPLTFEVEEGYYSTGSHYLTNFKKGSLNYRLVWVLDEPLNVKQYEEIVTTLIHDTFKDFNPDAACIDLSRMFFGGILGSIVFSEEPTSLLSLGWMKVLEKSKTISRTRDVFRAKKSIVTIYKDECEVPERVNVGDRWWEQLRNHCPLWDAYESGEHVHYNQRLTLFTNLKYLQHEYRDGSIIADVAQFFNEDTYKDSSFDMSQLEKIMRDKTLAPVPIARTSDGRLVTIPEFFRIEQGLPFTKNKDSAIKVKELDEWMKREVPRVLDAPHNTYFKSQTGSGKTEHIISYLSRYNLFSKKVIYAAPTHQGLREFEERFREVSSQPVYRVPEQTFSEKDVLRMRLGLAKETKNPEHRQFINKLLSKDGGLYLITHSLLTNLTRIEADLIVVDENIESALVRESIVTINDLNDLRLYVPANLRGDIDSLIDTIQSASNGDTIDFCALRSNVFPYLKKHLDEYLEDKDVYDIPAGLFDYDCADGYRTIDKKRPCVRLVERSPLIEGVMCTATPIKLFSATPMNKYLSGYYQNFPYEFVEAPYCRNTGRIIQYRGISGARGIQNDKIPEQIKYIRRKLPQEVIDNSLLISFKDTAAEWDRAGFNVAYVDGKQTHFMNNAGLDCFKGMNLIVAGKFDKPDDYYLHIWDDIGDGTTPTKQNVRLNINGFTQTLYLWDKPVLRDIQIQNINYTLEQTVGRARVLRKDATVYVFSNFIINDTDEVFD